MCNTQSKVTRHYQEIRCDEKEQAIETDPTEVQIMELLDKGFKRNTLGLPWWCSG